MPGAIEQPEKDVEVKGWQRETFTRIGHALL
jgi:hypothetical protein